MTPIWIALLLIPFSQGKEAGPADKIISDCEIVLAGTAYDRRPTADEFQDHLALMERHVQYLSETHHPRAAELRGELETLYEDLVKGSVHNGFKRVVRRLAGKIKAAVDQNPPPSNLIPASINGLLIGRDSLAAQTVYENDAEGVSRVGFTGAAVKELSRHERNFLEKVYKSIHKGIVRRENTSGIKRLTSVNAKLVELKIHPTAFRLMGCLENGEVIFKEAVKKSGAFFAYSAYADFCP